MPKVSVHILTWNSERVIENALGSLEAQTFKDFSVLIVDNASTDRTVAWLAEHYPQIKIVKNSRNRGFAGGHNQAVHFSDSEFVLMMNDDAILTERYLERVVKVFKSEARVGAVQGKLYKLIGDPQNLTKNSFTKIFDSAGIKAYRSRRFVERGSGEIDEGQYDTPPQSPPYKGGEEEIFGASGALPCYRRSALGDVRIGNEYFDDDFGSYKEDVDLAWRLQIAGWQARFVPKAIAYHLRTAAGKDKLWDKGLGLSVMANRRQKPAYVHMPSYRNHLCTLVKNEQNFKRDWAFILWYEFRKLVHSILFEQKTLKGLWQFFKLLPKMRRKRKVIMEQAKVSAEEIRHWFR